MAGETQPLPTEPQPLAEPTQLSATEENPAGTSGTVQDDLRKGLEAIPPLYKPLAEASEPEPVFKSEMVEGKPINHDDDISKTEQQNRLEAQYAQLEALLDPAIPPEKRKAIAAEIIGREIPQTWNRLMSPEYQMGAPNLRDLEVNPYSSLYRQRRDQLYIPKTEQAFQQAFDRAVAAMMTPNPLSELAEKYLTEARNSGESVADLIAPELSKVVEAYGKFGSGQGIPERVRNDMLALLVEQGTITTEEADQAKTLLDQYRQKSGKPYTIDAPGQPYYKSPGKIAATTKAYQQTTAAWQRPPMDPITLAIKGNSEEPPVRFINPDSPPPPPTEAPPTPPSTEGDQ